MIHPAELAELAHCRFNACLERVAPTGPAARPLSVQCTPSRSALMTGRYAIRSGNGTVPMGEGGYGLVQWEVTMAEIISTAANGPEALSAGETSLTVETARSGDRDRYARPVPAP